jgi:hypothetical protein
MDTTSKIVDKETDKETNKETDADIRIKEQMEQLEQSRQLEMLKQLEQSRLREETFKKFVWPTTQEEWSRFDMNKIPIGMPMPYKLEKHPEKYIINGILQHHLIPKKERRKYMFPWQQEEIEVPRNPDGTIIIIDHKQVEIDKLKAKLESLPEGKQLAKVEEQERKIDMLTEHLIQITNQLNELTKKKLK